MTHDELGIPPCGILYCPDCKEYVPSKQTSFEVHTGPFEATKDYRKVPAKQTITIGYRCPSRHTFVIEYR